MERDLAIIAEQDQFEATRREGRRLALAIAADIVAYRGALMAAGITDPLLSTLVEQFSRHWLGDGEPILMDMYMGEGDD